MTPSRVVVDLGGTTLRLGTFTREKELSGRLEWALEQWPSPGAWLKEIPGEHPGVLDVPWVIGIPGPVGPDGRIGSTPNLPEAWSRDALPRALAEEGVEFELENDANLAALGEFVYGAGNESSSLLGCTLGTGFGSGLIVGGDLMAGHHGYAPEAGHMTLKPDGRVCTCGDVGCAETYVSGRGLERTYREITGRSRTAKQIVNRHREDVAAADAVESFGYDLGHHLANLVNLLDVEAVVIGGGLGKGFEAYEEPVRHAFRQHLFSADDRTHVIRSSSLEDPALRGGAAWSRAIRTDRSDT